MIRRRAVSLVELLLAMSACAVILTLSTTLIHRVLHAQSKARAFASVERSAQRLSEQFRRDVHAATAAEEANLGAGVFLRLQLPDKQTIEYRRLESAVQRALLAGNETRGRESFAFPAGSELTVRRQPPDLVMLLIASSAGEAGAKAGQAESPAYAVPVSLQITARLGRTHEIAAAASTEGDVP